MSEPAAWWKRHFFEPFSRLKSEVGPVYEQVVPPEWFGLGREFARHLWACCDDEDMGQLARDDPDGAAQFVFLASIRRLERLSFCASIEPECVVISHKPFAVLASAVLAWMDEIEARHPRKTTRRR